MASEELSMEAWLTRGSEAYQKRRFEEAAEHFAKAVAKDPSSVDANLALGATRLTLYQRRPQLVAKYLAEHEFSEQELAVHEEKEKAILAEQNLTNWPLAENSLRRANQLDPDNALIVEYLCVLYFFWKDPRDEANDRMNEAKLWLERLLELNPEHKYADFHIGMMLTVKAQQLLPNYHRFPHPPDPDHESRRMKVAPLLEEATRHLERALALHGERTAAAHFLDKVVSIQAYLVDPDKSTRDLRDQLTESFQKHLQATATEGQSTEPGGRRGRPASITFRLSPEAIAEDKARPFPPNPWRLPV